jgi:hypothetical protein
MNAIPFLLPFMLPQGTLAMPSGEEQRVVLKRVKPRVSGAQAMQVGGRGRAS